MANETGFQYSDLKAPESQPTNLSNKSDAQGIQDPGFKTIVQDTSIQFQFNGTGIAVLVANYDSVFPPIPDEFLPKWECFLDDQSFQQIERSCAKCTQIPKKHCNIPDDGKKRVCQVRFLEPTDHMLRVKVTVPSIPAFFHSIRYVPLLNESLTDASVRFDPLDPSLDFQHKNWDPHGGLKVKNHKSPSILSFKFQGQELQWFGSTSDGLKTHDIDFSLDGKPYSYRKSNKNDGGGKDSPLFTIDSLANSPHKDHILTIQTHNGTLKLDHLLVTAGNPMSVKIFPVNTTSTPTPAPSRTPPAVLAGSIIGGVVGLVLLVLAIFLGFRYIRRRHNRGAWKDSALPSSIEHPASRVSSRSSFSREVVTGDVEYNPKAEKKLDVFGAQQAITEPPTAIILHADSGMRIRLQASEVPPRYTQG